MAGKVRRVKLRVGEPGERTVESLPAISIIKISHQPKSDFIRTCLISAGGLIYLDVITQELADMGPASGAGLEAQRPFEGEVPLAQVTDPGGDQQGHERGERRQGHVLL